MFCARHNLIIINTFFKHHPRRKYTWKVPGDIKRAEMNYILVRKRYRNQVKDKIIYPGVYVNSNHNLFIMYCELKFKRLNIRKGHIGKLGS